MWNFGWNPQPMGLHGQFCGGDPMGQQSQAQAQAQITALQQQNAMLNQHLHSLNLISIRPLQPINLGFPRHPDEMLQQMKSTVESSIQAMVEKTQVQSTPPSNLPATMPLHPPSHYPSTIQHSPPRQTIPVSPSWFFSKET